MHRTVTHSHRRVGIGIEALARLGGSIVFAQTLHEDVVVLGHSLHSCTIITHMVHDDFHHRRVHDVGVVLADFLRVGFSQESLDALRRGENRVGVDILSKSVNVAFELLVDNRVDFRQFLTLEGVLVGFQHFGEGLLFHLGVGFGKEVVDVHALEQHQCHCLGFLVL